jgi:hypothetical protein
MAITIESVQVATNAAANVTVTKPVDLAVSDLMVVHLSNYRASSTSSAIAVPDGWTAITDNLQQDCDSGGASMNIRALYKIADAADVAASNFTFTSAGASQFTGAIYRITGYAPTVNIDVANSGASLNDATPSFNITITPNYASDLLLFLVCAYGVPLTVSNYAVTTSNPSWTENYDRKDLTLLFSGASATRPEITATGNATCNLDSGDGTTESLAIMISIANAISVTVSPAVVAITASVQAPAITGGSTMIISSPITITTSVNTVASVGTSDWNAKVKSSTTSFTNITKS